MIYLIIQVVVIYHSYNKDRHSNLLPSIKIRIHPAQISIFGGLSLKEKYGAPYETIFL